MKKKGFTMIELMIVVAIIAILASIIMPKLGAGRNKAQLASCKSNLRHIVIAMQMYSQDNGGYYTPNTGTGYAGYWDCSYLVPTYLRSGLYCPLGNRYLIASNHPAWQAIPFTVPAAVFCGSVTGVGGAEVHHQGLGDWCPYTWVGGPIKEN